MNKSFTLVELIIVIVIFSILAGIAVPKYITGIERARQGKARTAMMIISHAEKMRAADNNGVFVACAGSGNLQANLGSYIEMTDIAADTDWGYAIAVGAGPPGSFTITATKAAGLPNAGETVTYTDGGVWDGTFTP